MVMLVCLGSALAVVGLGQVRSSTAGRYIDPSLGPEEPGYAAFVTPTPTLLAVHRAADGQLAGAAVLALQPGDEGGSVILMPAATRAFFGQTPVTFAQGYAQQGIDGVSSLVEQVLKVSVHETVEVDDALWATLVEPVGTVPVDLDSAVGNWPAGVATLGPADVGPFLALRNDGQSELTRTDRQEMFWRAWLTRVSEVGDSAIAGEGSSGLGRFVSGIAVAPDVSSLPVGAVAGAADEQFEVNEALLGEEIARSIPYPQSPAPGVRLRVRLLNGTQDPGLTAQAAERLVQAGAEITISGNAASFDEPTTRILSADEANIEQAQWYAAILGIGAVEPDPASEDVAPADESERIDLTVVLGADAPEAFRR